ncbi:Short-chain dehydrogenase reductase 3b [Stylosanthes scabra]|uniref:Short-chain dehydrogenase reductase 3b n=1 Tax=Stylosanthes scabra TaxID=79078 RepID=A0ABU6TC03_9FABA|nr:Short-chain dehydrogenase reductase 3b [Stylosanthes scabra]
MSKQRLEGKVAIVTGGASGIGAETVRLFVENGAFVVIADVNDELGLQVATSIGLDNVSYHHCDVRDEKQVEETVAFAVDKYGSLDIMFSNAGIGGSNSSILDLDLNDLDNTVAVNVRGAAACIKHAARVMVERKTRGSIICTASTASMVGQEAAGHGYTTSKHGLLGLVRSACGELGAYGIRVNAISPYVVATPLSCGVLGLEASEVESAGAVDANLQGIVLKPIHIAEAALFLASDQSAYISGHNLPVDGGLLAVNRSVASKIK